MADPVRSGMQVGEFDVEVDGVTWRVPVVTDGSHFTADGGELVVEVAAAMDAAVPVHARPVEDSS